MTISPLLNYYYGTIEPGERLIDGQVIRLMIEAIGTGGITSISIASANGISGSVVELDAQATITLALGAITPSSIVCSGNISGLNLTGTNTGDQTIILTGDVTGAGTGSFSTTLANSAVTLAKMANLAANSIIGNNTGISATPIALTATQTKTLLSLNNVENTALSTWPGTTNITTLGTITSGTWNGSAINLASFSTGAITASQYPVFIGDSGAGGTRGAVPAPAIGDAGKYLRGDATWQTIAGSGTVTTVSVVTANGISGTVATATTTPAITLTLGAINPTTIGATTPGAIQGFRPTNYQTGTTYTLALTDIGKMVDLANAAAVTLTIPPHSSVAFAAEDEIDVFQSGSGQVTIAPGVGVTIISYTSKTKIAGQYGGATLKQTSTQDTWRLVGNLA